MFEFWADDERRYVRFLRELLAESEAMPLRLITEMDACDFVARLDCGHTKQLRAVRSVGAPMRCRLCYEERMRDAERMVEQ
jgi:hypothetical protein